jgi:hypothetical protein
MPLRSSMLSALLLAAGCATAPVAKAPEPRAARSPIAAQPARTEAARTPGASIAPAVPASSAVPVASEAPEPEASDAPRADPFGDVGFKEINEKAWLAGIRDKIAHREQVAPTEVCFSPGLLRAAFVRSSSPVVAAPARRGRRVPPRRHEIVVVDNQGVRVASFRPITAPGSDEPPTELRFLSDERLVYEVVRAPSGTPPTTSRKAPAKQPKRRPVARASNAKPTRETTRAMPAALSPEAQPPRLFVIQPLAPRAPPIRCQGFNFTFTRAHDRLAFVGGPTATAFVAVDGAQVYPRRGRTVVAGAPVWSRDGRSLAFLELPSLRPPRLVLVADVDDPKGDTTWDLPPDTKLDGAFVAWSGRDKLVVRRAAARPIFSASLLTSR